MAAPDPPPRPGNSPLPWRARLLVGAVSALHAASLRADGTVNRFLLSLFDRRAPPTPAPVAGVASTDHAVSDHLRVRLFTPTTAAGDGDGKQQRPVPVVVYFHGGGFVFHSAATAQYDELCRRLASGIPAVIASVDYRLAPEHRFPAPYDDGEAALRWVLAGAGGALPSPPASVFVAGDSAGGNVAGLVALQPFFGGEAPTGSELRLRARRSGRPGGWRGCGARSCPPARRGTTRPPTCRTRSGATPTREMGGGARSRRPWCASAGGTRTRTGRGRTRARSAPRAPRTSPWRSTRTPSTPSTCSGSSRTAGSWWATSRSS
ncbi:hypothetical protein C2845_PM03G12460 [Panicum miliaceum]|uniref:Alpha/beta hydrolase fold-3 domain-containing protein n=1 Tax=Panicum miliaceum TaxID=4540 RepID=A0A3L6T4F1_PANMI|nr:hypothetical protein C2845_PM03G12460 [Panicum miliaceum]